MQKGELKVSGSIDWVHLDIWLYSIWDFGTKGGSPSLQGVLLGNDHIEERWGNARLDLPKHPSETDVYIYKKKNNMINNKFCIT